MVEDAWDSEGIDIENVSDNDTPQVSVKQNILLSEAVPEAPIVNPTAHIQSVKSHEGQIDDIIQ